MQGGHFQGPFWNHDMEHSGCGHVQMQDISESVGQLTESLIIPRAEYGTVTPKEICFKMPRAALVLSKSHL